MKKSYAKKKIYEVIKHAYQCEKKYCGACDERFETLLKYFKIYLEEEKKND